MRSANEVKGRLNGLLRQELKARLAASTRRRPCNCRYNFQNPVDLSNPGGPKMGFCGLGLDLKHPTETWSGVLCDDDRTAQRCPTFNRVVTVQAVLDTFWEDVKNRNLPDSILQLIWVVEDSVDVKTPWWLLIWYRVVYGVGEKITPSNWVDEVEVLKALEDSE